jgi:hypothetical protein
VELFVINASTNPRITTPWLEGVCQALEMQLYGHFAPLWQSSGVRVSACGDIAQLPPRNECSPLIIYDDADQAGALGWHTFNARDSRIHGTVFVDPILNNGGTLDDGANSISAVLSHEALEAVADPYVNLYALMGNGTTYEPVEVCDRVQGDCYKLNGVSVSNFLGPRAFRDGEGPYDYLRLMNSPWEIRPGGYCVRYDAASGQTNTLWGEAVPQWQRDFKALKKERNLSRLSHRKQGA